MRPGFATRSSAQEDPWDEIWAGYDAAHRPLPLHALAPVRGEARAEARTWARNGRVLPVLLTMLALLGVAASAFAAPRQAARELAAALRSADQASLAALVDWQALLQAPPLAAAEEAGFLASLSRSIHQQRATPEGLAALVQARVGPGWPDPAIETTGLASARLVLASTSQPGRGIALSLALQDYLPPRWRVVAVEPLG
ncbi:MAG: hypothetical protein AVDCRST_MAG27-4416 [uncultured Craurococcus sp.]|uniref:Uncharacterized protein n=1 Tax=uncultured Craurococcus sp. TaxID=1135998 RepID=A0A6J4JQY1_9PROT|nr:MAG: hypothetical protein AVDCRST_MAG27-4416 [uncultured Craurococcus sp.]